MNWWLDLLLGQILWTKLADTHGNWDQLTLLVNLPGAESIPELIAVLVVSEPLFDAALTVALSMEGVGLLPTGCSLLSVYLCAISFDVPRLVQAVRP